MKNIYISIAFIMLVFAVSSQDWVQNLPQDKVQNGNLTFFEMQKAFNDYWEPFNVKNGKYLDANGELVKATGWNHFRRWEWYWENRINPETGGFPNTSAWEELQKFQAKNPNSGKSVSGNWESMGPDSSPGGYAGLGRINCVAFHPTDNDLIYAGAASGGLWKTTDGGATWTVLSDSWAVQGVSNICVVPGSPNTIYAATGDRQNTMWSLGGGQNHDNNSVGVLKTTDGGASWFSTGLSFVPSQKIAINRMIMDPSNSSILYAATTVGVYKTTDDGTNWSLIYGTEFSDMDFRPGTSTTIYGSNKAGDIYRSLDSGNSWTATLTTTFGRVEMAVTPANPNIVYAVMQDLPSPVDESPVYKSTDGGASFTRIFNSTTQSLFGYLCDGTDVDKSQASYDLCIAADPYNANTVFVGGVNIWKSTDGGANWNIATHWSGTCGSTVTTIHADQHYFAYQPGSDHLFVGNDGGLYKTTNNGTSWSYVGSGLVTTQIYRIGVAQSVSNKYMLGSQDNGTKAFNSIQWNDVIGGDGMECIIDYTDPAVAYGTGQQGVIKRTTDYWATYTDVSPTSPGAWVTPYVMDPVSNSTLYAGYSDVWKTTDQGTNWTQISTLGLGSTLRSLAVAPSNTNYIYTATQTAVYRTIDGGTNWANITGSLPVGSGYITYLSVKADDPNTVWVSLGNYSANRIYQTTIGGTTWTSISAGLPSVPVMCVIQNKQNTSRVDLYASTDVGVYVKAGTADWQLFSSGLPTTLANELDIYYDANPGNSKIYAGTYGRGLWSSDLYESGVLNPTNVEATASSNTQIDISWALASGNNVMLAYNTTPTFGNPVDGTAYTTTIPGGGTVLYNGSNTTYNHTSLNQNTTYYYKIWSYDGSTNYSSGITASTSTFCTLINTFPWTEGFENGGVIPNCWTQEFVLNTKDWAFQTGGHLGGYAPSSAHTGTYNACLFSNGWTSYTTKLIAPPLDLSSTLNPILTFWHTQTDWSSRQDILTVYYKTSMAGNWVQLASYSNSISVWTQESIELPNPSSTYFIAFEGATAYGFGVCLDDIKIAEPIADFTVDNTISCSGSLTVNFTDISTGASSWAWDVDNDGTTDYTTQNPTHTYNSTGLYSVKLTVNNGVSTKIKENLILVLSAEPTVNTGCNLTSNSNINNGAGIGIYRFAIGNIDHATSHNDGYYHNYCCTKSTTLELNKSYNITIQTGTFNNEGARVYIDYNDNGTFETGESVVSFPANKDGTRTLPFTTPSSGVVLDKGLRLRVLSKFGSTPSNACDITTYGQAEDYTVYIMSDATWAGTTSTDWATSGNWNINSVPISSAKVKIPSGAPNYPVLTSNVSCKDLTLMSGASLTINPGIAMTVTGTLSNNAGTNGLVLKADASGTASLLHNTNNIDATVESYISQSKWHLVSPPVSGATSNVFLGVYLKYFVESDSSWHYITSTTDPLNTGTGYSAWSSSATTGNYTANYSGALNNGDFSPSISFTSAATHDGKGWNIVGNPYPSAIHWNTAWGRTNLDATIYVYDAGTSGNYLTYNTSGVGSHPTGDIAPGQGFWVRANNPGASLTIPQSERKHSSQQFYKSGNEISGMITLIAEGNEYSDKTIIYFNDDASENFDSEFDAWKIKGMSEAPQIYSFNQTEELAVNVLPFENQNITIPLGFEVGVEMIYSIAILDLENLDDQIEVYLEDLKENTITDLRQVVSYTFTANPNDGPARFLLHFNHAAFATGENTPGNFTIYSHGKHVYIRVPEFTSGDIMVYNMMGQEMTRKEFSGNGLVQVGLKTKTGHYLVTVQTGNRLITEKVFIR